jgi:proteasome lid subunit RPN8/RPN11
MLMLAATAVEEIIHHAREHAPIEACGYLGEKDGQIQRVVRLKNVDASPEHFSLDPKEQFAAMRQMRGEGYALRAVYHSHPASPARPSQEDIRLAFDPQLSYVIVSLAGPLPDVKSFRIRAGVAESEEIRISAAIRKGK